MACQAVQLYCMKKYIANLVIRKMLLGVNGGANGGTNILSTMMHIPVKLSLRS